MVALRERLSDSFPLPERLTSVSRHMKAGLTKAALKATELYGERVGPSEESGRHVLTDDTYHFSVESIVDKAKQQARTEAKAAKEGTKGIASKDKKPGAVPRPVYAPTDKRIDTIKGTTSPISIAPGRHAMDIYNPDKRSVAATITSAHYRQQHGHDTKPQKNDTFLFTHNFAKDKAGYGTASYETDRSVSSRRH